MRYLGLEMRENVVLLGDSIFDNRAYTGGAPSVVEHLNALLPHEWTAWLGAVDGSTTEDLATQVAELRRDATRIFVSIGGNDALLNADILNLPVSSTREALLLFGARASEFERNYRAAISDLKERGPRVTVCTIHNGNLPANEAPAARVGLMLFNDAILRVAFELGLDVIDLRLVCTEPADYANPIEPSGRGGLKIARAIAGALGLIANGASSTQVHVQT